MPQVQISNALNLLGTFIWSPYECMSFLTQNMYRFQLVHTCCAFQK